MKTLQIRLTWKWLAMLCVLSAVTAVIVIVAVSRGSPSPVKRMLHGDFQPVERSIRRRLAPVSRLLRLRAAEQFVEDHLFPKTIATKPTPGQQ